jgi:uncharacterized protein DUF6851
MKSPERTGALLPDVWGSVSTTAPRNSLPSYWEDNDFVAGFEHWVDNIRTLGFIKSPGLLPEEDFRHEIVVHTAQAIPALPTESAYRNAVAVWNSAGLRGVRDSKLGAPMTSRALAIMHACTYDAWAAYDDKATGTQLNSALRRPSTERSPANKEKAFSYPAYRALSDILSANAESAYKPLMKELGYDPDIDCTD